MKRKFLICLLIVSLLISSSGISAFANSLNDGDKPKTSDIGTLDVDYYSGYLWELDYIDKNVKDFHSGNWEYIGKHISARDGEYVGFPYTRSYSHSFSGSLSVSKSIVEGQLGYEFGYEENFGKEPYCSPLPKRWMVKAYVIDTYSQSEIHQKEIYFVLHNGEYTTYEKTGETKVAYANKAILPDVAFEYYDENGVLQDSSKTLDSSKDTKKAKPKKVEIYRANENGEYELYKIIEVIS